jgi:hypothetical protein
MKDILLLISLFIALSCLSLKAEVQIDRKLEAEQVALWTQTLEDASYDIPIKRLDKLWLGLRNMGHRMSGGGGAHSPEVVALYKRIQEEMLSIPGHAEYFGRRIREANEPLKGPEYGKSVHEARNERMYGFQTLSNLPSPETVKVVGEMLSDTWRKEFNPPPGSEDVVMPPNSLALDAIDRCLQSLPLRDPPSVPRLMAGVDPEVAWVHPWQSWWKEIKSGRKTFSFKGQAVEYRFKPDGTWETLAMANPPDDGPKRFDPVPAERPDKRQPSLAGAEHHEAAWNGRAWIWISGVAAAVLGLLAWLKVNRWDA